MAITDARLLASVIATEAPATFTRTPDGAVRVEQRTTLNDGRVLTIRGERVSRDVIRDARPPRR